jgi:hypothetical protein
VYSPVDNLRRRGATIAGFRDVLPEAGSIRVATPPNRELSEPFGRSGTLVHIKWYSETGLPSGLLLPLFSPLSYSPQNSRKIKNL